MGKLDRKMEVKKSSSNSNVLSEFLCPVDGRTYADISRPLRALMAKSANQECEDSYQELKQLLMSNRVLANFKQGRDTRVYVDETDSPDRVATIMRCGDRLHIYKIETRP